MLKDRDNKILEEGFYLDCSKDEIVYFTGDYTGNETFATSETASGKTILLNLQLLLGQEFLI